MLVLFSHDLYGSKIDRKFWHGKSIGVADIFLSRIPLGALALVVFYGVLLGSFGPQLFCLQAGRVSLGVRSEWSRRAWLAAGKPPTERLFSTFPYQEANQSTYLLQPLFNSDCAFSYLRLVPGHPQHVDTGRRSNLKRMQLTNSASTMHPTYIRHMQHSQLT